MKNNLPESWSKHLREEFNKDYMIDLKSFLVNELKNNKNIYPHGKNFFKAFELTAFEDVKVVILGQDPYHGPNQAHGLSFSVPKGQRVPPSLVNIYKEIQREYNIEIPNHGNLLEWANRGVFLLNAVLSVEAHKAASHRDKGWEIFTDKVINRLNSERENLVFMLWGSFARSKSKMIDKNKHLVLEAPHPSPLSAYRGFIGCGHFSKCNKYLKSKGLEEVNWLP